MLLSKTASDGGFYFMNQLILFFLLMSSLVRSCYAERHFSLTVDFQDMSSIFAVSCCFCDSDHVVSAVLQPQV